MTTEAGGDWPAPSESVRVQWLLTVAEGVTLGAVAVYALLAGLRFATPLPELDLAAAAAAALLVALLAVVARTGGVVGRVTLDRPPAYHEWRRIRSWRSVGAVASMVGKGLLTASVVVWGWESTGWGYSGDYLLLGVTVLGGYLWAYTLYKSGPAY